MGWRDPVIEVNEPMEMHQVRYFLAVARTLNFTRAAEECNVSQPSLSRAIKQLELELGGELFRRERPQVQMTSLGLYMHPPLKQCYESALAARALAQAVRKRTVASLGLAVSLSVNIGMLLAPLALLRERSGALQIRLLRGQPDELLAYLKNGEAELGLGVAGAETWNRLDHWPLLTERFGLLVAPDHPLAAERVVSFEALRRERIFLRPYCEKSDDLLAACHKHGLTLEHGDEAASDDDLVSLIGCGIGVAVAPIGLAGDGRLRAVPIAELSLERTVSLIGVAGRRRSEVGSELMRLLRAREDLSASA
jgi:DNA-binding transcriptional LysR family regulator